MYFAYTNVLSRGGGGGVLYVFHCGQCSCILLMTFWKLKEYFTIMSSQDVFYLSHCGNECVSHWELSEGVFNYLIMGIK